MLRRMCGGPLVLCVCVCVDLGLASAEGRRWKAGCFSFDGYDNAGVGWFFFSFCWLGRTGAGWVDGFVGHG